MGQCNPLNLRVLAELHHIQPCYGPSRSWPDIFGSVLRVVDEKIRAINKFGVSRILPSNFPVAACQHARVRFVVTGIHHVPHRPPTDNRAWALDDLNTGWRL